MKPLYWKILLGVLLVSLLGTGSYMYWQYQQIKKNPKQFIESENAVLLNKISQLAIVPTDEQPTIADILDKTKLTDQSFFSPAENGDKLLIYGKKGMTILYRPSSNKIVSMGSLQVVENEELKSAETEVITIAVLNGSKVAGAAESFKKRIQTELTLPVLEVSTGNAIKNDYAESKLIRLSDKLDDAAAQKIAETLGITVGTLPEGEKNSEADILIILGSKH